MHPNRPKSYYDELGVKPDATDEEIRQAFRRKAKQAHPDKGGSQEAMSAANRAYETLISPARRLTYDRTGDDRVLPLDAKAREKLVGLVSNWLVSDHETDDMMGDVTKALLQEIQSLMANIQATKAMLVKMTKRFRKFKIKGKSQSPIHDMLKYNISQVQTGSGKMEDLLAIAQRAIELSKEFEYERDKPPSQTSPTQSTYSLNILGL